MHFTDLAIRNLKLQQHQKIYFDDNLAGFGIRVSNRSKTFVVLYGKPRRFKTLGKYPTLDLKTARSDALRLLAIGDTPKGHTTYSGAVGSFLEHCEGHNRPSTVHGYRCCCRSKTATICRDLLSGMSRSGLLRSLFTHITRAV